jgi:hypothetical protein
MFTDELPTRREHLMRGVCAGLGAPFSIVKDYIEQQRRPDRRPAARTAKTGIGSSRP